jgi:hypothetical protein
MRQPFTSASGRAAPPPELERYSAPPGLAAHHPVTPMVQPVPGSYYVPESQPINKTTVAVMGMGFVLAALVIVVIAAFVFVSCSQPMPPSTTTVNEHCERWCF